VNDIPTAGRTRNYYDLETHLEVDEEALLIAKWYELGDEKALERLYRSHLKAIAGIAHECRLKYPGIPFEDFHQAARLGFLRAIDRNKKPRYEPGHASRARLWTYAAGTPDKPGQVRKHCITLASKAYGHGFTKMPKGEQPSIASCEAPAFKNEDGESASLGDFITDAASQSERGDNWLRELPQIEREVYRIRAEEGLSFDEISAELGKSREWARLRCHHAHAIITFPSIPSADRDVATFLEEYDGYRVRGIGYLRRSRQSSHIPFDQQLKLKRHDWAFSCPRSAAAVSFGEWHQDPLVAPTAAIMAYLDGNPRKTARIRKDKGRFLSKSEIEALVAANPDILTTKHDSRGEYASWYKLRHAKQAAASSGWSDTETDALAVHEKSDKKDHSIAVAHVGLDGRLRVDCQESINEQIEAELKAEETGKKKRHSKARTIEHVNQRTGLTSKRHWDGKQWLHLRDKGGLPAWLRGNSLTTHQGRPRTEMADLGHRPSPDRPSVILGQRGGLQGHSKSHLEVVIATGTICGTSPTSLGPAAE
jgi:hypothetical protein